MILTPRQHEIARLCASGLTRAEVARRLALARGTIDTQMTKIYRRLGVTCQRDMARVLPDVRVGRVVRGNGYGLRAGDPLQVIGGRYAGRVCEFVGRANSLQAHVRIGSATLALRAKHLQPLTAARLGSTAECA